MGDKICKLPINRFLQPLSPFKDFTISSAGMCKTKLVYWYTCLHVIVCRIFSHVANYSFAKGSCTKSILFKGDPKMNRLYILSFLFCTAFVLLFYHTG